MTEQIYQTQKSIYKHMRQRALSFEDRNNKKITSYRKNYEKYSARIFKSASQNELNKFLASSNFIFIGDFHTFDQSLKNLIRILKFLSQKKVEIILALEMVSHNDSKLIEYYLNGHITEMEFLESINFGNSWKFPWTHYRAIFDFVKSNPSIKIVGVNKKGSLLQRDKFCAQKLFQMWSKNPSAIYVTLYGEYHLAPNKIPCYLKMLFKNKVPKISILHQNLDIPYWKILSKKKSIGHEHVIKFNNHEYCLLTSPPWMKFESMSYWFENLYEDPEFDLHQYIIDSGLKALSGNTADNFEFICQQMLSIFKLPLKTSDLAFTLYDHGKLNFIERFIKTHYKNKKSLQLITTQLKTQHSLLLPDSDKIYCASYSANKLAKLAGNFLYQSFCNSQNIRIVDYYNSHNTEALFSYYITSNFYSYFMAKAVNPYMKCDLYLDLKNKSLNKKNTFDKRTSSVVLKILEEPSKLTIFSKKLNFEELLAISKIIGELVAESNFQELGRKSKRFDAKEWKKNFLITSHNFKTTQKLIHSALQCENFKNLKKRYY